MKSPCDGYEDIQKRVGKKTFEPVLVSKEGPDFGSGKSHCRDRREERGGEKENWDETLSVNVGHVG